MINLKEYDYASYDHMRRRYVNKLSKLIAQQRTLERTAKTAVEEIALAINQAEIDDCHIILSALNIATKMTSSQRRHS